MPDNEAGSDETSSGNSRLTDAMEQIRSFIAIELPDEVKSALAELQAGLQTNKQPQVKWADPYGIHLTLKFLGNIAAAKISDVAGAMEEAARGFSPFRLR